MSRHSDGVTVSDADSVGPHCLCIAMHILDAFYRKHRHQPSLPTLRKRGKGQKGAFSSPRPATASRARTNGRRPMTSAGSCASGSGLRGFLSECLLRLAGRHRGRSCRVNRCGGQHLILNQVLRQQYQILMVLGNVTPESVVISHQ